MELFGNFTHLCNPIDRNTIHNGTCFLQNLVEKIDSQFDSRTSLISELFLGNQKQSVSSLV